jgi:gas vesicle protein
MCELSFVQQSPHNISIIVAVVALIGTLIGATIGAAANYILAVRRERSDRAEEKRKNDIEVKRAARLIYTEFLSAMSVVALTMTKNRWSQVPLSIESWQKYSHILAPELSDKEWIEVTLASISVDNIIDVRKISVENNTAEMPLGTVVDKLKPIQTDLMAGLKALEKWHADKQ